ncbi:hypothetical protein V8E53_012122 [Lactarius tabidus]
MVNISHASSINQTFACWTAFLCAAAWLVFSPVLLMAASIRGRSSVMPCQDQYGRLSTLCLLLGWQPPTHRGAVGSVVSDILSSIPIIILSKGMVPSVLYLQR